MEPFDMDNAQTEVIPPQELMTESLTIGWFHQEGPDRESTPLTTNEGPSLSLAFAFVVIVGGAMFGSLIAVLLA